MKNIVFLVMPNFPNGGACPNILSKLAKALPSNNNYYIVAPKESTDDPDRENYYGTIVIRIPLWSRLPIKEIFKAIRSKKKGSFTGLISYFKGKMERLFFSKKRSVSRTNSLKIVKELERLNIRVDLLVPFFGIFDILDASVRFKKKHPSMKLVLFQLDPLSRNKIERKTTYKSRLQLEQRSYSLCDRIVTTKVIFAEVEHMYLSFLNKTVYIEIPNVDLSFYSEESNKNPHQKPVCTFLGTFYKGIREPYYAVSLFESLNNVVFNIVGANRESFDFACETNNTIFYGKISQDRCNAIIKNSDFLVNIGNNISNQIPSKIFDYISTGKPIINICDSNVCPSISYLANYPASLTLIQGEELFSNQTVLLNNFIERFIGVRVKETDILKYYSECTIEHCLEVFLNILNDLLGIE